MTSFAAIFANEVRLNTKRIALYALMILFSANAVLWWGWGPAVARGWATNSEFYIQRNFGGFSFGLGLPIFTAIIMGDPIIRDFRLGVDPLIFSKPIGRASYVLGKFFGNFFVLVCCQSAFAVTLFLLQWVPFSGMVTLPVRVVPYFKHFFVMVVISHLVFAAIYFTAGTLTRSAKAVYGLAACFYPAFIAFQLVLLSNLPNVFRVFLDPVGFNLLGVFNSGESASRFDPWSQSAEFLNRYVAVYSWNAWVNRASMIAITCVCLFIVYWRFTIAPGRREPEQFTKLTLVEAPDRVVYNGPSYGLVEPARKRDQVILPKVTSTHGSLAKLLAAIGVEFRLLRAERGFIVLIPLAIFLSFLSVPFSRITPEVSYSVTSATNTANMLLLFLPCVIVFSTGEAMHRDREVKIEPVVWSTPTPNSVLLLSKWFATTLLAFALVIVGGLTTIVAQLYRGHTPVDVSAYIVIAGVVVVPGIILLPAVVIAWNALLRNKYLAYVTAIGTGAGLLYLYNIGYNHWLYNPLLYRLWTYHDLTSARMFAYRFYCLALAAIFLALAHLFYERKSS